jgi:hypothetical protein
VWRSALIGGVAGGLAVLLVGIFGPRRVCPDCGHKLPKFGKPPTGRRTVYGGWKCPGCGCEVDRKGKKVRARDEDDE